MLYGLQSKHNKEIDMKFLKSYLAKNKSKLIQPKLKEYDNFRKLIYNFMRKKYKYVSYVFGGFAKIHEESTRFNIPLLNHDENCNLCKTKTKKTLDLFSENFLSSNKKISEQKFLFNKNEGKKNLNKENKINGHSINNLKKNSTPSSNKGNVHKNENNHKKVEVEKIKNKEKMIEIKKEGSSGGGFFSKLFKVNKNKNNIDNDKKTINNLNNTIIHEGNSKKKDIYSIMDLKLNKIEKNIQSKTFHLK